MSNLQLAIGRVFSAINYDISLYQWCSWFGVSSSKLSITSENSTKAKPVCCPFNSYPSAIVRSLWVRFRLAHPHIAHRRTHTLRPRSNGSWRTALQPIRYLLDLVRKLAYLAGPDTAVQTALRRLPTRQREVIVLRVFLDLDIDTTARQLGIAPGTVRAHLSRAMTALRNELALAIFPWARQVRGLFGALGGCAYEQLCGLRGLC